MKFHLILLLVPILILSCGENEKVDSLPGAKNETMSNRPDRFRDSFDSAFSSSPKSRSDSIKAYFVIPNTGCPGCISSAEQLFKMLISDKYPIRVILTNVSSYKILRLKFGDSIVNNPNVYVDRNNEIYKEIDPGKQAYPMVVYVDSVSHHLSKYEFMEPENPESMKHIYDYIGIKF